MKIKGVEKCNEHPTKCSATPPPPPPEGVARTCVGEASGTPDQGQQTGQSNTPRIVDTKERRYMTHVQCNTEITQTHPQTTTLARMLNHSPPLRCPPNRQHPPNDRLQRNGITKKRQHSTYFRDSCRVRGVFFFDTRSATLGATDVGTATPHAQMRDASIAAIQRQHKELLSFHTTTALMERAPFNTCAYASWSASPPNPLPFTLAQVRFTKHPCPHPSFFSHQHPTGRVYFACRQSASRKHSKKRRGLFRKLQFW